MRLTAAQVQQIRRHVEERGVTLETLKDDLVDHLCCAVEIETGKGESFESAFQKAVAELAPKGFDDIQAETIFLLNPTNIIAHMKKVMYLIGLLSSIAIAIGWLFSILHWTGARELFNYGFIGFLLIFVPLFTFDRLKGRVKNALAERLKIALGCVSAVMVGISLVFKLLHLHGADRLLVVGMVIFAFGFLPFLFFTTYRKAVSRSGQRE